MPSVMVISHSGALWGAQLRLCESARALGERGVTPTLAAPPGGPLEEAWTATGHRFVPFDVPRHDGSMVTAAVAMLRATPRVARIVAGHDIVQSHSTSAHLEVALAGRSTGTPVVLDVHDVVASRVGRQALRLASRLASVTVANSSATAATVGGVDRPGVRVVFPGVDIDRFRPGPCAPEVRESLAGATAAPLVGILGRVDPVKGIEQVVEAVAALRGRAAETRLVVVGDAHRAPAGYAAALEAMARRRLGERVRFVGTRSDVPQVLRALDVVVGPWRVEPFGRSVAEAQATGLPVVAPAAGGPLEIVSHGETGFLVPLGQPAELSEALTRLVTDAPLRERMGRAGRERVCRHFSLDAQTAGMVAAYEAALGRPVDDASEPSRAGDLVARSDS